MLGLGQLEARVNHLPEVGFVVVKPQAHVGISISQASGVAIEAAQVVLLAGKLKALPTAIEVSRLTTKTIRENLFWAFSYNLVAIPLAAMGFLNPMWAALFMAFSDVVVIGNSIRLKRRKIKFSD